MNPLSPNWGIVFFYSFWFYKVSRIITYDKYGEQTGLALGGLQHLTTHLESTIAIPNCPQVSRTGEQNLNLRAGTGAGWLMSFERHLCQTKVIVFCYRFVIVLDIQLASDFRGSCGKS